MDLKSLQRKAKQLIDRRGGTDSLKADAEELKDIAKGPGSVTDKAKLAGNKALNLGIVTSYNDMLSAHQPYGTYPDLHCIEGYIFREKVKIVSN